MLLASAGGIVAYTPRLLNPRFIASRLTNRHLLGLRYGFKMKYVPHVLNAAFTYSLLSRATIAQFDN